MSDSSLQTQADNFRIDPLLTPLRKPILLSDSKGFRLQNQVRVNPESYIEFWCQSRATSQNRLEFLKRNLPIELSRRKLQTKDQQK